MKFRDKNRSKKSIKRRFINHLSKIILSFASVALMVLPVSVVDPASQIIGYEGAK